MTLPPSLMAYPYLWLFLSLLVAGETVLLPAIYLGIAGRMSLVVVLGVSLLAVLVADSLWYALGRRLPRERVFRLPFVRRHRREVERLERSLRGKVLRFLVVSKLVYGSRIAAQVACGVGKVPFRRYCGANAAATLVPIGAFVGLAYAVRRGLGFLHETQHAFEISFAVFALLGATLVLLLSWLVKRRWSDS